jgi:tetratricopeptide (TPR) repeat protein
MRGNYRALALAMVAWDAANEGFPAKSREAIRMAEADDFIRTDEEASRIQAYLAAAEARMGSRKAAEARVSRILDPQGRIFGQSMVRGAQWARDPGLATAGGDKFPPEPVPELVRSLDAILVDPAVSREQKRLVFQIADQVVGVGDPINASRGWARLARTAHGAGFVGEAALYARRAMELAKGMDPRTEDFAGCLAASAQSLALCGDRAEAQKCLDLAAERPERIALFFQPPAWLALAEAQQAMGRGEQAEQSWIKALKVARSHHHPRARDMNVVLALMSLEEAGREPTLEMVAIMDSISRGEGGTAALPPGFTRVEAKPGEEQSDGRKPSVQSNRPEAKRKKKT